MAMLSIIDELGEVGSRLAKEAILEREKDNQLLKDVFIAALNPFVLYYISKIPEYTPNTSDKFNSLEWALTALSLLSNRTLTGHAGRDYLISILESVRPEDAMIVQKIIDRDLRCGVSDSTVNKQWPKLIPSFEVQLADKYIEKNKKHVKFPSFIQTKLDGYRLVAFVYADKVEFKSRGGKLFTTLEHIEKEILELKVFTGYVLDGEAISGSFNNTSSDIKRKTAKNTDANFHVFDILTIEEFNAQQCKRTQVERIAILNQLFDKIKPKQLINVPVEVVNSHEEVLATYGKFIDAGYEGAILKWMDGLYEFDRTRAWMKIKPEETVDVEIIGYEEGEGKHAGRLGAWIVDYKGKACRVGGGYKDWERDEFWKNRNEMIGYIIEVKFMEETEDTGDGEGGKMRHPNFKKIRYYKGSKV